MNKRYLQIHWLLLLLCLLASPYGYGQDSTQTGIDTISLRKATTLMLRMDSIQRADSLRRAELLQKIENLNGSEANKQREALLGKLRKLETQDSIRKTRLQGEIDLLKSSAKGFPVRV